MRKELIIIQQDLKDCGVCCLQSIIKYYHGYVPLEKIRIDTATSMEGTNAYQLIKAAKSYGFNSLGKRLSSINDINDELIYPCIAHIATKKYSHFVVIYKSTKDSLILMDPAKGKVVQKKVDFMKTWTNIIIELYPQNKILNIKTQNFIPLFSKKLISQNKNIFFKIFLYKIFLIFFSLVLSFHFKINLSLFNNQAIKTFMMISTYFILGYFFKVVFNYFENYQKNLLEKKIDTEVYHDFLSHLFLLPDSFIKNRTSGEIMTRVEELSSIKEFYSNIFLSLVLESILLVICSIVLFHINLTLFLTLGLFLAIYILIGTIYSRRLFKKIIQNIEATSIFNAKVLENLDVYTTLKNLGVLKAANQELNYITNCYLKNNYQLNEYFLNFNTFCDFLEQLLNYFIITFGFILIYQNKLSIVDLYTFLILIFYPINYIKNLIIIIPKYTYIKAIIHKINDYFDIPIAQEENSTEFSYGDIRITNLTYCLNYQEYIFQNLNLVIFKNSHVMLKGSSGCGKSTLCKLITRSITDEYMPITIDGHLINTLTQKSLEQNITYVGQRENLIQDTIKNNILFYRQVSEEKLKQIISLCALDELIKKKPLGLETFLFKDSSNLSGGEKQRIILARALLNDFKILILDEALSELNEDLEIGIIKNLRKNYPDKTIIYVTHKNHDEYFDDVIDLSKKKEVINDFI